MKVNKWFTVVCFLFRVIVVNVVKLLWGLLQFVCFWGANVDHQWFCVAIGLDCFFVGYCDWVVWLVLFCIYFCELWFHKQHMIAFYFKRNLARAVASAMLFFVVVPSFPRSWGIVGSFVLAMCRVFLISSCLLNTVFWANQHVLMHTVFDFHCNFDSFWNCSVSGDIVKFKLYNCLLSAFQKKPICRQLNFVESTQALFIGWWTFGWTSARNFACLFPILLLFWVHFPTFLSCPMLDSSNTNNLIVGEKKVVRAWLWWCWRAQYDSSGRLLNWFFFPHSFICWDEQQLFEFNHVFSGLFVMIRLISYYLLWIASNVVTWLVVDCFVCFAHVSLRFLLNFWEEIELCCWNFQECVKTQSPMITISADR